MKSLSVFIPGYNEGKILEKNIILVYKELKKLNREFELVVVDDSSKDNTKEVCKNLGKKPGIKCLRFENGPSRRENLAEAMKKSKNDIILFMDCDLATDISYLPELISYIDDGYDVSIGSRYSGLEAERTIFRIIFSRLYNSTIRTLFNSKIKDHQCGFKAFKKEVILKLIKEAGYDKDFVRGWFWDAEILIRAQKNNYKIREFPVKWIKGEKSSFNFFRELKVIGYMLGLRMRL